MPVHGRAGYNARVSEERQSNDTTEHGPVPDPGLKRLLTYTLIALVLAVLAALLAVNLVIRWFDTG
jgi:hypothetical protein